MQPESDRVKSFLTHLGAWIALIVYEESILFIVGQGARFHLIEAVIGYMQTAFVFYVNRFILLPRLYNRQRYVEYALGALMLLGAYALLRIGSNAYLLPFLNQAPSRVLGPPRLFWGETIYRGLYFVLLSFGYWFAQNALQLEKHKLEREHELRIAEKNLMAANIAFLKNQINPHFLFNSLNFLYAQVYPHSEESAKGILLLSDIMRYALKEEENNGKVMLAEEVQHLHNYIAINQLRFNHRLQIQFESEGSLQFLMILPLVLITFVENCFKHGELADPLNPLRIRLQTVDNQLTFQTHNKKRTGPKEKSTGIGLANTRQRLDIVYPGRYNLTVKDEQDYYTCTLIINL